ncbi:aminodeoxychorismate lyase [Caldichromatium japonicum]|uniref:Aminodeoxychorismate lyase n=1 Tax=Caldichromatium japonicum TaxID=2699430 RepID=A0A6G7VDT6_9GAMM|nr:aminodeoxychorismate lyase [Caldichromatium japonicum]QIK38070.1 aminodeoxychorismate lyase [Caldichromatium japonicum]
MGGGLTQSVHILIDGQEQDQVPALDRAIQYGDGLFETIRIVEGRPCQWQRHLDRLSIGAERLGIPLPDVALWVAEAAELIQGQSDGVLKLILTRGEGGRGYRPPDHPKIRRLVLVYPPPNTPDPWQQGVGVRYCQTPAAINPALAGIKHLNRLDSVLARAEWDEPGIAEGLMFDATGVLVGGTMTNVFLWDGARLLTPPVDRAGIAGTVRGLTLELAARMGVECLVTRLDLEALDQVQGLFLTNSLIGVWPVRELAGRRFDLTRLPWALINRIHQTAFTPG